MTEAQIRAAEKQLFASGGVSFDVRPTSPVLPVLPVHWISCRAIAQKGFPLEGPAISFEKGHALFSSGHDILNVLDPATVTIQDDEEWYHFPEIGVTFQKITEIENYFAVAFSARFCRWGAGFSGGKKNRESAARLALAVAIASGSPHVTTFGAQFPGFASLCNGPVAGGVANIVSPPSRAFAERPTAGRSGLVSGGQQQPAVPLARTQISVPQVHWVTLAEDSKMVRDGWPSTVPAFIHDKAQQPFFSMASSLLDDVLGKFYANFYHEADWERLPEVGNALKLAIGPSASEYCFCVATCEGLNQWAYGLAWGKKTMETAAKLALAYQIALASGRKKELMRDYPEFKQLVEATDSGLDGTAIKRARIEALRTPPCGVEDQPKTVEEAALV